MKKIGDSTNTANANGEWSEGNPAAGLPATLIKADWLTTIQRELINLVLGAGIALNKDDDSQVFKAIQAIQAAASTWAKLTGKPTTISGFGITDAFTKTETGSAIQTAISALVASSPAALDTLKELATALGNDPNFATTITNALAGKAAKATTLVGYGITDAFNKTETGTAIQAAVSALVASSPAALDTLKELADALGNDPSFATTMTNALASKAPKATTLAGYGITDAIKSGAYGLGDALALPGGADLNTIIQPGIYFYGAGDNPVNVPMAGACYLEVVGRNNYPHQVFRRLYQNRLFTRAAKVTNPTAAPADWEAWVEDAHTGNLSQLLRTTDAVATETLFGVIRGATQTEVDAGLVGGLAVTPVTLKKHSSIGVAQAWQDMTASRGAGTTYTNSTGRPIFVVINTPSNTAITATVSGLTIYGAYTPSSGQPRGSLGFIVPPGGTYSSTASSGFSWLELR